MDRINFTAKTLDEAITKACVELGVTSERLDYIIVETGSNGVFGIGSRPYVIGACIKEELEELPEEQPAAEAKAEKTFREEKKDRADRKEKPEKSEKFEKNEKPEKSEKSENRESAAEGSMEALLKGGDPSVKAEEFLKSIFASMGLDVEIRTSFDEILRELNVDLSGDTMGVLIGKRGQTLDALQYLTGQVVNKHTDSYVRVKLDTESYRDRRKDTLETLALNIAQKVRRTRRPVALEPMNPYERRIIHSVLQGEKDITTRSEGEEPYRHVVVCSTKKRK